MTFEFKIGLLGALGIHALALVSLTHWFQPNQFNVMSAPSSLEIALVSVKVLPKIEIQKERPKEHIIKEEKKVDQQVKKVIPEVKEEKKVDQPIQKVVQEVKEEKKTDQQVKKVIQEVKEEPKKVKKSENVNSQQNRKIGALTKAKTKEYHNNPPIYPRVARERGYEGELLVKVFVTKKGFVEEVKIIRSSGYQTLDRSAIKSVRKWQFYPAEQFGVSIDSVLEIPFIFRLDDVQK